MNITGAYPFKSLEKAEFMQYRAALEARIAVLEERLARLEDKPKRGRPPLKRESETHAV